MAEKDPHRPPSLNALTHGGRSQQLLVGDEKQEDFDRLNAGWRAEFEMEGQDGESLLGRVILNDWLLRRAERNYLDLETKLGAIDPLDWTLEQHKKLELFLRYKTTAERSFSRWFNMLRGLRKDRIREEFTLENLRKKFEAIVEKKEPSRPKSPEKAQTQKAPEAFFRGQDSPKKQRKIVTLEQWVEVTIVDGKTVTRQVPSNDELIERGKRMWPAPELVYRRFNFVNGIPEEYHWAADDPQKREYGGAGIQRMTVDTWLETIEHEKNRADGHLGPTPKGIGNLPRPKERGGCDCEVCTKNQAILDRRAARR